MVVEGAGEDRHEGGQERETALSSFGRFVPHLSVEGPHYVGDLGVQEGERAVCGVCVVCGVWCVVCGVWCVVCGVWCVVCVGVVCGVWCGVCVVCGVCGCVCGVWCVVWGVCGVWCVVCVGVRVVCKEKHLA